MTREHNLRDVLAAYDAHARTGGVDLERIALVGSSYGAYLGAIATTLRPVRWLALRAPAIYTDEGWRLAKRELHRDPDFAAYRQRAHSPEDNRVLGACARFRGDALVVESGEDRIVPHPVVASYVAALGGARSLTYRVLEGADHGLSSEPWKQAYTQILTGWLTEMTAPPATEASRVGAELEARAPKET